VNGCVTHKVFRRFVAIGDSLTEGLGDERFHWDRRHAGWADRLAAILHETSASEGVALRYANLAVRSRKIEQVMTTQLEQALDLKPDLVTVMAGGNNLWSSGVDWARLSAFYRDGISRLRDSGATVLVANSINPVHVRAFGSGRARAARMTEMIEAVAAELDCGVIDLYRNELLHDVRAWARDRVHFGVGAHSNVANAAAGLLRLSKRILMPESEVLSNARHSARDLAALMARDVTPYFVRVARGTTAGDRVVAKRPQLSPIDNHPWSIVDTVSLPAVGRTLSAGKPLSEVTSLAFGA
jgi:lysophospholipase L1-like esterase